MQMRNGFLACHSISSPAWHRHPSEKVYSTWGQEALTGPLKDVKDQDPSLPKLPGRTLMLHLSSTYLPHYWFSTTSFQSFAGSVPSPSQSTIVSSPALICLCKNPPWPTQNPCGSSVLCCPRAPRSFFRFQAC